MKPMNEVVISSKKGVQIWSTLSAIYKQFFLIKLFVKRDFSTYYKQTVLGPTWFFIQPVFQMLVYMLIFGRVAGISTGELPQSLFFLSGIICWTYFSENTLKISSTFIDNAHIFGKVYFPRIVMPVANMITAYIKLGIQFILLILVALWVGLDKVELSSYIILVPVVLLFLGILSTSVGLLTSALTTKYRDLKFLVQFGIQLLMYLSAVIWPFSTLEKVLGSDSSFIMEIAMYNPISHFIESFRFFMFGKGYFDWNWFLYSCSVSIVLFFLSLVLFTRVEKDFMDTI